MREERVGKGGRVCEIERVDECVRERGGRIERESVGGKIRVCKRERGREDERGEGGCVRE